MKTVLQAFNAALLAVHEADVTGDCKVSTGNPSHEGEDIDVEAGLGADVVPSAVVWSADRGNWMWDGVLASFRALGVDVDKPVSEVARFW